MNRMFNCHKHFFRQCEDRQLIARSPATRLRQFQVDTPDKKVWSDLEIERVLSQAAEWASEAFYFLAMTAARAGEMARLTWNDVSLDGDSPHVTLRSRKGNGKWRIRHIPLVGALHEFIVQKRVRSLRAFQARPQDEVFRNASGKPVSSTHLSREMGRLTGKLGMSGLTLHGLRHTFLTRMVESDSSLEKVRQISGHSNLKTLQQYLHVDDANVREAMQLAVDRRVIRLQPVTSGNKDDTSTG